MACNDLLQQVGGMGRFQKIQFTLLVLPLFLIYLHSTLQNFTAAIPTHHCRPPAYANLSKVGELEAWLPLDRQGQPESCLHFTFPQRGAPFPNGTEANDTEPCTNGWIYDNCTFPSTIVTEGDLVCTHKTLPQLSLSIFMAGMLVGSLMFGTLADRLGCRKVLIWTYLQFAVSGTCAAFTPNFSGYCICRFLLGMAMSPINTTSLTLSLEWLPIHTRPCLGLLIRFVPSLGHVFLAGVAYAVPQWRHKQLLLSLPFFVFFIYSRFFIESALWYSSSDWTSPEGPSESGPDQWEAGRGRHLSMELLQTCLQKDPTMGQAQPSMLQMLCFPAVRRLFICLIPLWFASNFSIYGLAISLQSFEINIYVIQVLFAIADFSFCFLGFLAIKSLRHRPTQMAFFLLSGICLLACAMIPLDQLFLCITMATLGKGCMAGSINCLSVYTGELYPTVMQQRGQSTTMILANIGSTLSPLVGMTAELHSSLPFLIQGAVPVAACPIVVLLPETMVQPLPYTEQDLERRWKEKLGQKQEEQQMVLLQAS